MVIHQKEESVRYQVKSNDNFFVRWTEGTDDKSREHYDIWSDLDIYYEYNIESSRIFEREISKSHLDFKV